MLLSAWGMLLEVKALGVNSGLLLMTFQQQRWSAGVGWETGWVSRKGVIDNKRTEFGHTLRILTRCFQGVPKGVNGISWLCSRAEVRAAVSRSPAEEDKRMIHDYRAGVPQHGQTTRLWR